MPTETEQLELDVKGMTCASCANRVEKKLNELDGVEATVNFATERAAVSFAPGTVEADELLGAVGRGRLRGGPPRRRRDAPTNDDRIEDEKDAELRDLRTRLLVAVALSVPIAADRDDPAAAVRLLAVAEPAARDAGRLLVRLALPQGRLARTSATAPRRWTR